MSVTISSAARIATDPMFCALDGVLLTGAACTSTACVIPRRLGVELGTLHFLAAPPR